MKNLSFTKVVILSLSIIIGGYFIGEMNWNSLKNNRSVQVKGLSEREVISNLAVWPLEFTVTGNNLTSLNNEIESQKKQIQDFFKKLNFSDDEISVGVTNINDKNTQLYDNNNNRPFRYLARTNVTIRTTDIEKVKKAQKELINLASKGVLVNSKSSWSPIQYSFTNLNDIKPEMIEEATKKAKEVAEKFAKDSNSKVGKIKSAYQGLFTINSRDQNTPDIKIVRVVTTVNYFLED